jgi:hypothetical protein
MFHSRVDVASGRAKSGLIKQRNDLYAGPSDSPVVWTGKSRSRVIERASHPVLRKSTRLTAAVLLHRDRE